MASAPSVPDAWRKALDRFTEDLNEDEKRIYFQASPETILYEASAAEKIHASQSTSRHIVSDLQPFVDAIMQYAPAMDVFSNTYGLAVCPIWGSVRIVLHLARESGKYFEKLVEMFNRISDAIPRLRIYLQLFPDHQRLVHVVSLVYWDVLRFCSEAKKVFRKPKISLSKLTWRNFDRQFGEIIKSFRNHEKLLDKEVSTSHMIEAAHSRDMVKADQEAVAQQMQLNVEIEVFSALSTIDNGAQHERLRSLKFPNTGSWILQHPEYFQWQSSATASGLCAYGIPGSGKSVLTSSIVDDLSARYMKSVLYHYCDYANRATLEPAEVYRTLVQQCFLHGLLSNTNKDRLVRESTLRQSRVSESTLNSILCHTLNDHSRIFVVLDGLDECEKNDQKILLEKIKQFVTLGNGNLKVFITCREEAQVLGSLSDFKKILVSTKSNAEDITNYISTAVSRSRASGELHISDQQLEQEIITSLASKARGMFLWVHFQLMEICEASSTAAIRHILAHLPDGLHSTYERILHKIKDRRTQHDVWEVFMWLCCARRPLTLEELQEAVAFDSTDRHWNADKIPNGAKLIQSCNGLVVRHESDNKIYLAHHTVGQFLVKESHDKSGGKSSALPPSLGLYLFKERKTSVADIGLFPYFTAHTAEAVVSEVCTTYLCFSDFDTAIARRDNADHSQAIWKQGGPIAIPGALGISKSFFDIAERFKKNHRGLKMPDIDLTKYMTAKAQASQIPKDIKEKYALLDYVVRYWPTHTASSENGRDYLQFSMKFVDLVRNKTLAFEFRPWGPNGHHGVYGCVGCPPQGSVSTAGYQKVIPNAHSTPHMSLLHWAAENGHIPLLRTIQDDIENHFLHEMYHKETIMIACRNGRSVVLDVMIKTGNLFSYFKARKENEGQCLEAACQSGDLQTFQLMVKWRIEGVKEPREALRELSEQTVRKCLSAVKSENSDIVEWVLETYHFSDPNVVYDGKGILHMALETNSAHLVSKVIELGADPNIKDGEGWIPIIVSSRDGNVDAVKSLLRGGARCYVQDFAGETAMIKASRKGYTEIVKLLLRADGNLEAHKSKSALSTASRLGHTEIMKLLLEAGTDPDSADVGFDTSLHYASRNGHMEIVKLLLEANADPNLHSDHGQTPLQTASEYGYMEIVKLLLEANASPDVERCYGRTPLTAASKNRHIEIIKLLLEANANPDLFSNADQTPLLEALEHGYIEIVKLLLDANADPNLQRNYGRTPLVEASKYGHIEIVKLLLEANASPGVEKCYARTPLAEASQRGHVEVVRLLLSAGADPDHVNSDRFYNGKARSIKNARASHCAAFQGHSEVLAVLPLSGALCSIEGIEGMGLHASNCANVLHLAAIQGYTRCLEVLAQKMTEPSNQGIIKLNALCAGYTALEYARTNGHVAVGELLRKMGAKEEAP